VGKAGSSTVNLVIKPSKIIIDVPVRDVPRAVGFYCNAFAATVEGPGNVAVCSVKLGSATLRIFDVALAVRNGGTESRLRFPPIELRVDGVDGFVRSAKGAGAAPIAARLGLGGSWDRYVEIRDPFGHEWAFAFVLAKPTDSGVGEGSPRSPC
jgi:uncharacterized glyoxalase superfamily protein PhnB